MSIYVSARMNSLLSLSELLLMLAEDAARVARKKYRRIRRKRRGATLRPGPDTPLWNEVARLAGAELKRYGAKAGLARMLRVPRQRIHQYVKDGTAAPDAERTLMLLAWLQARRIGRDLA